MICKKCGTELPEDAKICTMCGSETEGADRNEVVAAKNNKAAFLVIGGIVIALLCAVAYLIASLLGVGNPQVAVKNAFIHTIADFAEKNEYEKVSGEIMESSLFSQELSYEFSDFYMRAGEEEIMLPEYCNPIRLALRSVTDTENKQAYAALSGGIGDMQDISLEAYIDKASMLFGAAELYPDYFMLDFEELQEVSGTEFDLEESFDTKQAQKAMTAIGKTFALWTAELYDDVKCEKKEKSVINTGDREINAQEYYLYMKAEDFTRHLEQLPAKIEDTEEFMDYMVSLSSSEEADEWIDALYDITDEIQLGTGTDILEIGHVYVSGKKVVQLQIPFEDEIEEAKGSIAVSFFGRENVSDDVRVDMLYEDAVDDLKLSLSITDGADLSLNIYLNDNKLLDMSFDGEYQVTGGQAVYTVKDGSITMEMEEDGYGVSIGAAFSAVCTTKKEEGLTYPDKNNARNVMELSDEEISEFIVTFLGNMSEKNCVPSQLKEDFDAALLYIPYMLEGMVYGIEEEYPETGYETGFEYENSSEYESGDNPYLHCVEEDLIIEMCPINGFRFAMEYSTGYGLMYEKQIGESDMIIMDFSISTETKDEYLEWEADFNREYYTEAGYQNVEVSEIKSGIINGHPVSWFEYSAAYDEGEKANGIIAGAKIDDEHICTLDIYSFYGTEELTEDLLYECFNFYIIEN